MRETPHTLALKAGQVITKESFPSWWELHLKLIYWGIKKYQRLKWGRNWKPVHVYVVVDRITGFSEYSLFEQTYPVAKYINPHYLWDKTYAVCEWMNLVPIDSSADGLCKKCREDVGYTGILLDIHKLTEDAESRVGTKYDLGDLLDFAFSGMVLKIWRSTVRIWGDKAKRLGVCSTVVAGMLKNAGCNTIQNPHACDPAYFEGNGQGWHVVRRVRCGEVQEISL